MIIVARILCFLGGAYLVLVAFRSAIRTLVLSRSVRDSVTFVVFRAVRGVFGWRINRTQAYLDRDRIMAYYAPASLMIILVVWMLMVLLGFMAMFWATGIPTWGEAFVISGSSLLTLGFGKGELLIHTILEFAEAAIGLILIAMLIAYLPTMYSAFSRRETSVSLLEVRAGSPPSAIEMLLRYHRNQGLDSMHESWQAWETWFAEIEESHTSLAALVFFRSPQPEHSWVTAAGAVLDAASLRLSTMNLPMDVQAALCIRAGYLAFRRIADYFEIPYDASPSYPGTPIRITREEFEAAYNSFLEDGLPLKPDREQAWQDFAGWRVNYDALLYALGELTMAPMAPWFPPDA